LSNSGRGHGEQELCIWIENLAALSAEARAFLKILQAKVLRKGGIIFYFHTLSRMT
jgi:hypothetical protein